MREASIKQESRETAVRVQESKRRREESRGKAEKTTEVSTDRENNQESKTEERRA